MNLPPGHNVSSQSARLREFLVKEGLISPDRMKVAQYDEAQTGLSLEDILILRGWIDKSALNRASLKICREQLHTILQTSPGPQHPPVDNSPVDN